MSCIAAFKRHSSYIPNPSNSQGFAHAARACSGRPSNRAYNTAVPHSKLVIVRTCGSRVEANLAKSVLEAEGIPVLSQADTAGGMREHLAWSGEGFRVLVREEDLPAAREVLVSLAEGKILNEGGNTPDFSGSDEPD
jgi:hypothetical protein